MLKLWINLINKQIYQIMHNTQTNFKKNKINSEKVQNKSYLELKPQQSDNKRSVESQAQKKIHDLFIPTLQTQQYFKTKQLKEIYKDKFPKKNIQIQQRLKKLNTHKLSQRYQNKIQMEQNNKSDLGQFMRITAQYNPSNQKFKYYNNKIILQYIKNNPEVDRLIKNEDQTKSIIVNKQIEIQKGNQMITTSIPIYDERILRSRLSRQTRIRTFKRQFQNIQQVTKKKQINNYFQARSIELRQSKVDHKKDMEVTRSQDIKNLLISYKHEKQNNIQRISEQSSPLVFIMTPKILPNIKNSEKIRIDKKVDLMEGKIVKIKNIIPEFKISGWEKDEQKNEEFYNSYS